MTSQDAASPAGPARSAPGRDPGADARTLAELSQPGSRPVLIKGAVVLSQDPGVGDYAVGDILIRDGKVAHVGEPPPRWISAVTWVSPPSATGRATARTTTTSAPLPPRWLP